MFMLEESWLVGGGERESLFCGESRSGWPSIHSVFLLLIFPMNATPLLLRCGGGGAVHSRETTNCFSSLGPE